MIYQATDYHLSQTLARELQMLLKQFHPLGKLYISSSIQGAELRVLHVLECSRTL